MRVNDTNFQFAHNTKPRGVARWAFDFGRNGTWTTMFVPHNMSFTDAKRWAVRTAKSMGCTDVHVAS